jgi:multidrug efflux system membrane fusion protein
LPIDGRAGIVLLQTGNVVEANDTPATVIINQSSPICVSFTVPEQHLGSVRTAMRAGRLRVDAQPTEAGPAASTGTLAFFDNTVDMTTGTVWLRAKFPNADRTLWPGQFATVTLTLGEQVVTSGQSGLFPGAKIRPAGERAEKGSKGGETGGTTGPEQGRTGTGEKASPAADGSKGGAR